MKGLSSVINYINSKIKEFVSADEIKNIVNLDELETNEVVEIFRALINHNRNVNSFLQDEAKKQETNKPWIQFNGYKPKNDEILVQKRTKTTNEAELYIELFKVHLDESDLEQILAEIYSLSNADEIILELLLYLNNEKSSIIKMMYNSTDSEDHDFLTNEITEIDNKIAAIQAYAIETSEEVVEIPRNTPITLLRLPSGKIGLLKDIEAIMNSFYNETEYYKDLLELLEAIKTGNFISVKKLHGIDSYEDRNYQFRLSFSYYKGMIVITSLFVKKSNCDTGVYATLKSRLKVFNKIKDTIVPNEEDIQTLDTVITDLKEALSKRGGTR